MTSTRHHTTHHAAVAPESIFARILVGVDGTKEGFDACRQTALLADPDATLEAATVVQLAEGLTEELERHGDAALTAALAILGRKAETRRLYGLVVQELIEEAQRLDATLLAIGTHGHRRIEEIVFGGVAGELLHRARCSVLVARPVPDEASFPRSIVVGLDGSPGAEHAWEVACRIGRHRHSPVEGLVALGGKHLDTGKIFHRHSRVEAAEGAPVKALVDASASADLVVVGSRGLHGMRGLGSVSERVAHQAACSVLVVR